MLNAHKSKIDNETQPNCETCQAKEKQQNIRYLFHCSKREVLCETKIYKKKKNSQYIVTLTMEDMFGEQNFMDDDHKSLREAFEKYINST